MIDLKSSQNHDFVRKISQICDKNYKIMKLSFLSQICDFYHKFVIFITKS